MAVPGLLQSNNIVPAPGNMDIINQSFYTDTILLRTILGIIVLLLGILKFKGRSNKKCTKIYIYLHHAVQGKVLSELVDLYLCDAPVLHSVTALAIRVSLV